MIRLIIIAAIPLVIINVSYNSDPLMLLIAFYCYL